MADIGRRIRIARAYLGMTQSELAEKINKTRPLVSHIESTGKVNAYTLQKICGVLNLELEDLMNEGEELYQSKKNLYAKNELIQLKEKVLLLEELVQSQREIIGTLKQELERKKR